MSLTFTTLTTLPTSSSIRPSNLSCRSFFTKFGVTSARCSGGTSTVSLSLTRLYMLRFADCEFVPAPYMNYRCARVEQTLLEGAVVRDDVVELGGEFDQHVVCVRCFVFDDSTPLGRQVRADAGRDGFFARAVRELREFVADRARHDALKLPEKPLDLLEEPH